MEKMKGAKGVVKCLIEEGVNTIFGFPGGAIMDVNDELFDVEEINYYLSRHEQGAVHAADGYARATGEVGVALLTSGPGATNGVTGVATAYYDSIPLVVLTGQVPTPLIGNDAFQEVDIVGITRPCTKHNYLVTNADDLVPTIREAFHIARTGRPGPVLIDLPKDVLNTIIEYPEKTPIRMQTYQPTYEPHIGQVSKACKKIMNAKKPVLYVGGGVINSNSYKELTEMAIKLNIPVTMTLMGLGGFPGDHELSMGMLGMHGTYVANMAVHKSDLLISVGARFDDRVTGRLDAFAPNAEIIHIDIDPTSISKNVTVDIPIVADCKYALTAMNNWFNAENESDIKNAAQSHEPWLAEIKEWNDKHPLRYKSEGDTIKPQYVIEKLNELTEGEAIITTEVGQHQMWTAQFYKFVNPRQLISSGGLGTMGFGLPAAIGAKMAFPNKTVIDIAGDGSLQMVIQELATAKQYNCPIKVVLLNNNYLGMVRQWQELFYDKRYAATVMEVTPDFVKLAEAYGAVGMRATKSSEVESVLKKGLATDDIVIMEFAIAREECVFPMVPAGAATTEMLLV